MPSPATSPATSGTATVLVDVNSWVTMPDDQISLLGQFMGG